MASKNLKPEFQPPAPLPDSRGDGAETRILNPRMTGPSGWSLQESTGLPNVFVATLPDPSAPMVIAEAAYERILETVGRFPVETGGFLGGSRLTGTVDEFIYDPEGTRTGTSYYPDMTLLNNQVRSWRAGGGGFLGFAHSHPARNRRPSGGDATYAERILRSVPRLPRILMPILQVDVCELLPWVIYFDSDQRLVVDRIELVVVTP